MRRRLWAIAGLCVFAGAVGAVAIGTITDAGTKDVGVLPTQECDSSPVSAVIGLRQLSFLQGEAVAGRVFLYNGGDAPAEIDVNEHTQEVYGVGRPGYHTVVGTTNYDPAVRFSITGHNLSGPLWAGWGIAGPPGIYVAKWSWGGLCGFQVFEVRR